ncbi:hypothetical protein HMPREF0983_00927 [Erysipelotrichaceae bacterium 3_1_53]|nr:hypothetical protein HMPREF0983_00927 [Erysipelotrichaceae bacterium 3_1_53]
MKSKLQTYVRSIAVLLALTLLFSLVFAALYYFHAVSTSVFHIANWVGGILAYGAGGVLLGIGVNKKRCFMRFLLLYSSLYCLWYYPAFHLLFCWKMQARH